MGSLTCENWKIEGQRFFSLKNQRTNPETAFSRLANAASRKQVDIEMERFFDAKSTLERAIKKQDEAKLIIAEAEALGAKRRLTDITHSGSLLSDVTKSVPLSQRKRVRNDSPQPSTGVSFSTSSDEPSIVKIRKRFDSGTKKQRISPAGCNSVQENVPTSLGSQPCSSRNPSPTKVQNNLQPVSPIVNHHEVNMDLSIDESEQVGSFGDLSSEIVHYSERHNKSPVKSPKQIKKTKPSKRQKSIQNQSSSPRENTLPTSPPIKLSGITGARLSQVQSKMNVSQPMRSQGYQTQGNTVVISSTSHGPVVFSSPIHTNVSQVSPGKTAQSSYHNYAPPLAPLSINPMRLVGRAGSGSAISTSTSTHSIGPIRSQEGTPVVRQTPSTQPRVPIIVSSGGPRASAILTPAAGTPGVAGVLTIRANRPPQTVAVASSRQPVVNSTPSNVPTVVMRRITTSTSNSIAPPMVHSVTVNAVNPKPLNIPPNPTLGANGVNAKFSQAKATNSLPISSDSKLTPTRSIVFDPKTGMAKNGLELGSPPAIGAESVVLTTSEEPNGSGVFNQSIEPAQMTGYEMDKEDLSETQLAHYENVHASHEPSSLFTDELMASIMPTANGQHRQSQSSE